MKESPFILGRPRRGKRRVAPSRAWCADQGPTLSTCVGPHEHKGSRSGE